MSSDDDVVRHVHDWDAPPPIRWQDPDYDRTLIYMLFDALHALSKRVVPGYDIHIQPSVEGMRMNAALPIGMFDVLWLEE